MNDIEHQALLDQKVELVSRMNEINAELSKISNHVRSGGYLPQVEYRRFCDRKTQLCAEKQQREAKLLRVKADLQKIAIDKHSKEKVKSNGESSPIVRELVTMREKYQSFSADGTRVSSMRRMAAEFVIELNPIIKGAIRLAAKNQIEAETE